MATITEVAKRCGYSITTVSIVLNKAPLSKYIPQATKQRIRKAAKELAYQPNFFARSLRSRRSNTVGVIVFDITDPYCTQILRGIENFLYHSTFLPLLSDIQNNADRLKRYVQILIDRQIEGLIAVANSFSLQTDFLEAFHERSIPVVVIGRNKEGNGRSSVVVDNQSGAVIALRHLYELGHRSVAFIRGPNTLIDSEQRWEGVVKFARQVGLHLNPENIVDLEPRLTNPEAGQKAMEKLLRAQREFTAVMAFDDLTAFGAIRALHHAGLAVPQDCSVIGFDDVGGAAFYNPSLTTIRQPMEAIGRVAAKTLINLITSSLKKKALLPVHHKVPPRLVVRESTARIDLARTRESQGR